VKDLRITLAELPFGTRSWPIRIGAFPTLKFDPRFAPENKIIKTMETTWFTADTHFGHENIIKYTNRPFDSASHMNEILIANWNSVVGPNDPVYHLGDFALSGVEACFSILKRLNGKIHLIKGNHEKTALACADRFEWVKDYHEMYLPDPKGKGGKQMIVLMHYAMRVWNASHHGAWQLYGHSHGNLPDDPNLLSIDVGVDCHGYTPISFQQIKRIMEKKTWVPPFGPRSAD
jgi:calcineurin-like phosphoesterase family protein